jgi:hypothetical protein
LSTYKYSYNSANNCSNLDSHITTHINSFHNTIECSNLDSDKSTFRSPHITSIFDTNHESYLCSYNDASCSIRCPFGCAHITSIMFAFYCTNVFAYVNTFNFTDKSTHGNSILCTFERTNL